MQPIDSNKFDDKYLAAMLTARRARDLVDGKPPLTDKAEPKPVTQAINELIAGLIKEKI